MGKKVRAGKRAARRWRFEPLEERTLLSVPGITVSPTSGLVTTEAGETASFTVVLDTEPSKPVQIALSSSDATEGTPSKTNLTFNKSNWNDPQTVTITGVDDSADDGDINYTIVLAPATSQDANYNGLDAADVAVTNTDDDTTPVATGDSYSVNEDNTLSVGAASGVLANDTDADGDSLSAVLVSGPSSGNLTLNADGSFSYTPSANFHGSDSFTYKASDGTNESNTATVSITVGAVNDAPAAAAESYSVDEDTTLTVEVANGVLANDSDVEGDSLSAVLVSGPSSGNLTLNADGSFTYTPDANFHGSDSFTYKASDGSADGNTATVTITVNSANDAPTTTGISDLAVDAGAGDQSIPLSGAFADADGDNLTYTVAGNSNTDLVTASIESGNTLQLAFHDGASGSAEITVRATDPDGSFSEATFTVTVEPTSGTSPSPSTDDEPSSPEPSEYVVTSVDLETPPPAVAPPPPDGVDSLLEATGESLAGAQGSAEGHPTRARFHTSSSEEFPIDLWALAADMDFSEMYAELASLAEPLRPAASFLDQFAPRGWEAGLRIDPVLTALLLGNPDSDSNAMAVEASGSAEAPALAAQASGAITPAMADSSWLLWAAMGLGASSFLAYRRLQESLGIARRAAPVVITPELEQRIEILKGWIRHHQHQRHAVDSVPINKRIRPRYPFDGIIAVAPWVGTNQPAPSPAFLTCARDISKHGIGFVHTQPIELDRVLVTLRPEQNEPIVVPAEVRWTRRLENGIHICGAEFLEDLKSLPLAS